MSDKKQKKTKVMVTAVKTASLVGICEKCMFDGCTCGACERILVANGLPKCTDGYYYAVEDIVEGGNKGE